MTEYTGILHFYSETGTEGGHWAFQDERFMGLVDEQTMNTFHCRRCGRVWDRTRDPAEPRPSFTYWSEPYDVKVDERTTRREGGYRGYDEPHPEMLEGKPGSFDERWHRKNNATSLECYENGHEEWELLNPEGTWSYEGLHVLKDGDHLTVYDPGDKERVIWEGPIRLVRHQLFTEHAGGMWIHADQDGVDRETWADMFFKEHPAKLVTRDA